MSEGDTLAQYVDRLSLDSRDLPLDGSHSPNPLPRTRPSSSAKSPGASLPSPLSAIAAYFQRELRRHEQSLAKTVVVLQNDCYGHRYSRPKTTKTGLSTIVERPERVHAAISGIAAAYVRLGGRHSEAHRADPIDFWLDAPLPFRIMHSARNVPLQSSSVVAVHGAQWMEDLTAMCHAAAAKLSAGEKELSPGLHEGDLYLCGGSLRAMEGCLGAVCDAVDAIFQQRASRAFVAIRPPGHHCAADMPSGFCWVNNVHVGINHAATAHGLTHAAIIDFDLHHGDGSQAITWAHNARVQNMPRNTPWAKKTAIGYFSLHDINSYPCEGSDEDKVRNASVCVENVHGQSIWNVHLQSWKSEAEFWTLYEDQYLAILAKARSFLKAHATRPAAKAAIFLSAGFDASEWESPFMQRHQVNVPTAFYARFTRDVVELAHEDGLAVDGRVISVLEGGYSDRALTSGVLSHLVGLTSLDPPTEQVSPQAAKEEWWSATNLQEYENIITIKEHPKKRVDSRPTYSSATHASTARMVSPRLVLDPPMADEPPCSPSEVHWTRATHELSKLLVPTDQETRSCRIEDLGAEALRIRRSTPREISNPGPMQLRDKRAKAPAARPNRRRTLADVPKVEDLVSPPLPSDPTPSTPEANPRISPKTEPKNSLRTKTDVDSIASSMGQMSIKLRVPSREEHDARHPHLASIKDKSSPKKTVSPRKPRQPSKPKPEAILPPSSPSKAPLPSIPQPSSKPTREPLTSEKLSLEPLAPQEHIAVDIPYESPYPPLPSLEMQRKTLPVFTPTSSIAFGTSKADEGSSIWDVPKTPARPP